jgi:hypothetical protein
MIRSLGIGTRKSPAFNCGAHGTIYGNARRQFASPASKPDSTSTMAEDAASLKAETAALQLEGLIESQYYY